MEPQPTMTTERPPIDQAEIFKQLDEYPWDTDKEFQVSKQSSKFPASAHTSKHPKTTQRQRHTITLSHSSNPLFTVQTHHRS